MCEGQLKKREFEGNHIKFYYTGEIGIKGKSSKGFRDGLWTHYYKNGKISSQTEYSRGKKNGKSVTFPTTGGRIEEHFTENLLNGLRTRWYESGVKMCEGMYLNGRQSGLWNSNGTSQQSAEFFCSS